MFVARLSLLPRRHTDLLVYLLVHLHAGMLTCFLTDLRTDLRTDLPTILLTATDWLTYGDRILKGGKVELSLRVGVRPHLKHGLADLSRYVCMHVCMYVCVCVCVRVQASEQVSELIDLYVN